MMIPWSFFNSGCVANTNYLFLNVICVMTEGVIDMFIFKSALCPLLQEIGET